VENMKLRAALQSNPRDKARREERGLSLLVATVTTPREGAAYFKDIFPSMTFQLNKASRPHKISTLTVNTRPDDHPEFAALRAANEGDPRHKFVELSASPPVRNVSLSEGALSWGRITSQEVRLNYDLLEFLRISADHCAKDSIEFVVLMEDDFEWCPGALLHLLSAIQLAEERGYGNWLVLRTSVGLNGIVIPCQDLPMHIRVGSQKRDEVPLDSLFGGIWSNAFEVLGREYLTYRYNLFNHIGRVVSR